MRRRVAMTGAAVVVTGACLGTTVAWGQESSTVSAAVAASSATLQPPRSVTATANCPNKTKGSITVSWTASASAFTTGYTVTRAVGTGAPAVVATVSATTTSWVDNAVAGLTTYTYAVTATYRSWSSVAAAAPALTTPKNC